MKTQLLIPAAGMGIRLGLDMPKALAPLAGIPLLVATLNRLREIQGDTTAVIVAPPDHIDSFEKVLLPFPAPVTLAPGGVERQDSVRCGLNALDADTEIVVIHDAARPFVSPADVREGIAVARLHGAATLAVPVSDTILQADENLELLDSPDRSRLWACQTPQMFQASIIKDAYDWAHANNQVFTDDATLVKRAGFPVRLVRSHGINLKITTGQDLLFANYLLESQKV